jgi:predicted HTH domain antitoxin
MQSIILEIPENIAVQLKLPPKRAQQMLMEELAARLYEQGIITAAQGSVLLKMKRLEFEHFLATRQIPIHGHLDELAKDIANAGQIE